MSGQKREFEPRKRDSWFTFYVILGIASLFVVAMLIVLPLVQFINGNWFVLALVGGVYLLWSKNRQLVLNVVNWAKIRVDKMMGVKAEPVKGSDKPDPLMGIDPRVINALRIWCETHQGQVPVLSTTREFQQLKDLSTLTTREELLALRRLKTDVDGLLSRMNIADFEQLKELLEILVSLRQINSDGSTINE